jgi:hypothetical protein
MRQGFADIVSGWTLVDGFEAITEVIERAAEWTKQNSPLQPDEEATVKLLIRCQIARGMGIDVSPL